MTNLPSQERDFVNADWKRAQRGFWVDSEQADQAQRIRDTETEDTSLADAKMKNASNCFGQRSACSMQQTRALEQNCWLGGPSQIYPLHLKKSRLKKGKKMGHLQSLPEG